LQKSFKRSSTIKMNTFKVRKEDSEKAEKAKTNGR